MLVGGFKHEIYFPFHIWDVILPIDQYVSRWLLHHQPDNNGLDSCMVDLHKFHNHSLQAIIYMMDGPNNPLESRYPHYHGT